jgi:hypothetical protein
MREIFHKQGIPGIREAPGCFSEIFGVKIARFAMCEMVSQDAMNSLVRRIGGCGW